MHHFLGSLPFSLFNKALLLPWSFSMTCSCPWAFAFGCMCASPWCPPCGSPARLGHTALSKVLCGYIYGMYPVSPGCAPRSQGRHLVIPLLCTCLCPNVPAWWCSCFVVSSQEHSFMLGPMFAATPWIFVCHSAFQLLCVARSPPVPPHWHYRVCIDSLKLVTAPHPFLCPPSIWIPSSHHTIHKVRVNCCLCIFFCAALRAEPCCNSLLTTFLVRTLQPPWLHWTSRELPEHPPMFVPATNIYHVYDVMLLKTAQNVVLLFHGRHGEELLHMQIGMTEKMNGLRHVIFWDQLDIVLHVSIDAGHNCYGWDFCVVIVHPKH